MVKFRSPLLPIFLIVFVDILGLTIILPLLPFYSESLGATPFVVGLLVSSYSLCQLISGPFLGAASDRMGRKPLLLVSQVGTLTGFVMLALSQSLALVFLARIIDGLTAGNITVAQAYISDVTEPKDRGRAFGMIGAAFGLGFLLGPALSGTLAKYGNQYPIWAAAGLSALSILATATLLPGKVKTPQGTPAPVNKTPFRILQFSESFQIPILIPLLWQFFAFACSFSFYMSGFALFCSRRFIWEGQPFGAQQVGYLYAYSGFLGLVIQAGLMGKLTKWFGENRLVVLGFLFMSLGYGLMGIASALPFLLLCLTFGSFGSSVLRPAITSLISQNAPKNKQGAILGSTQSLQAIAQIVAPLMGGFLIDQGWLSTWAWACSGIAALGFIGLLYRYQMTAKA